MPKKQTLSNLLEENRQLNDTLELFQERLAELELALEDYDWARLSFETEREFSREGLRRIIALSRLMYLKNPLVNRGVNVQVNYVWAQSVNIQAADETVNEVVQAFWDDEYNQAELTSHQARVLKEVSLQVDGNLFFVFFTNVANGTVRVRTIPVDEIADIITNPEDRREVWFYKRVWTQSRYNLETEAYDTETRTVYYPDWRYVPRSRPANVGRAEIAWDTPVFHVKVGGLADMRFGVPETYQALDWARAYKAFLEDWATIVRAYSRFAFNLTTKGGARGIAAAKTKLGTTLGTDRVENNPPPVMGSVFIGGEGTKLEPIRTAGATTKAEDGRRLLLMVCAAFGIPESFMGDVSVGTLATAKSLDRPTELKFRERQQLWADVLQDILQFVIDQKIKAGQLPKDVDRHIDIQFPDILERDVEARVRAIVSAATLDGKQPVGTLNDRTLIRLLLQALGAEQIDELLDQIAPEGAESLMAQLRAERAAMAPLQGQHDQSESFVEALRELREAVRHFVGDSVA